MTDREYLDERECGGKEMNEICPTCNGSGGIDMFEDSIGEIVTILSRVRGKCKKTFPQEKGCSHER